MLRPTSGHAPIQPLLIILLSFAACETTASCAASQSGELTCGINGCSKFDLDCEEYTRMPYPTAAGQTSLLPGATPTYAASTFAMWDELYPPAESPVFPTVKKPSPYAFDTVSFVKIEPTELHLPVKFRATQNGKEMTTRGTMEFVTTFELGTCATTADGADRTAGDDCGAANNAACNQQANCEASVTAPATWSGSVAVAQSAGVAVTMNGITGFNSLNYSPGGSTKREFQLLTSVSGTPQYIEVKPDHGNYVTANFFDPGEFPAPGHDVWRSYNPGTSAEGQAQVDKNDLIVGTQTIPKANVRLSHYSFVSAFSSLYFRSLIPLILLTIFLC